ncbi:MobP2 family relaxase [Vagococcus xieshaowenii]|uniref:Relaxase n=1 Tax=Vagococcus xieshaowenii TaxID=2562451 RepID=A0AAJ5EG60_9ENTE|nr:MobP2 family relaxase [Vagococcus xieshaowenii]QCA29690.1 hypothetical protein E4Z98_09900 [Vagococcus xieshaowenii]TFZ42965.1 hypothetical protein E4031_01640 [Vagococcus xieshaowenii]
MSSSPGIIARAKFVTPGTKKYKKAIDYIDRSQAVRGKNVEEWHAFSNEKALQIKNNEGRITTLFSSSQDYVDNQGKQTIKENFITAQEKDSPMWQTVFSFDNDYLKELGLLQEGNTTYLNEGKIREATRLAIAKMADDMNLGPSVSWAGAIHYNTDNIHVHTMMVLTEPEGVLPKCHYQGKEQYRGKIPPKTVRHIKSVFANKIENREPSLVRISYLMREAIAKDLTQPYVLNKDVTLLNQLNQFKRSLPKDRRTWAYNHSEFAPYREELDRLTHTLMTTHQPHVFKELDALLKEQTAFYLRVYGENSVEGNQGKEYRDNKLQELRQMTGNALLRQLKSGEIETTNTPNQPFRHTTNYSNNYATRYSPVTKKDLYNMKAATVETQQDFLNKCAYEREQFRKEQQRKYEIEHGIS